LNGDDRQIRQESRENERSWISAGSRAILGRLGGSVQQPSAQEREVVMRKIAFGIIALLVLATPAVLAGEK